MMPFLFMGPSSRAPKSNRSDDNLIRSINRDNSTLQRKKEAILIRKGLKRFTFSDGFSCVSLNQRNADRKHRNHLAAV